MNDSEQPSSTGSSVYGDSSHFKSLKFDLNNSDTDDSEFRPKVDTNAMFEQSTNGETTPPTSSTSNVSHKGIELMTPLKEMAIISDNHSMHLVNNKNSMMIVSMKTFPNQSVMLHQKLDIMIKIV